jgi:hypothetical protein
MDNYTFALEPGIYNVSKTTILIAVAIIIVSIILIIALNARSGKSSEPKSKYTGAETANIVLMVFLFVICAGIWIYMLKIKKNNPGVANLFEFAFSASIFKYAFFFMVIIAIIISLLYTLGLFTNSFNEVKKSIIFMDYIIGIIIVCGFLLSIKNFNSPGAFSDVIRNNKGLIKYGALIFLYLVIMGGLYIYNPGNVMTNYGGIGPFISIFFGFALISILLVYEYAQSPKSMLGLKANAEGLENWSKIIKWTLALGVIAMSIGYFYWVSKNGITSNPSITIMFSAMLILFLAFYIWASQPENFANFKSDPNSVKYIGNVFQTVWILGGLVMSAAFLYWITKSFGFLDEDTDKTSKGYITTTIFNIILMFIVFYFIYKAVSKYAENNPLLSLVFNTILYIPCLLVNVVDFIVDLFKKKPTAASAAAAKTVGAVAKEANKSSSPIIFGNTTKNDLMFLGISVSVCGLYLLFNYVIIPFGMKTYYKQGGTQLVNNPIPMDTLTNVATYETLNGSDKYNYKFALSFWFYIDSFSPSTNTSYLKTVPILSYGDNPCISYHAPSNTLIITVKQQTEEDNIVDSIQKLEKNIKKENIEEWNKIQKNIKSGIEEVKTLAVGNEYDENGNRIIYKKSGILLQKWNNVVLNYSGGTLDVFFNGELVKSAIEVVPKIKQDMLTVGSNNGVSGNVANIMYFDHTLNYLTVNRLYTMLKTKNPPTISTIDETLIPLPREY